MTRGAILGKDRAAIDRLGLERRTGNSKTYGEQKPAHPAVR